MVDSFSAIVRASEEALISEFLDTNNTMIFSFLRYMQNCAKALPNSIPRWIFLHVKCAIIKLPNVKASVTLIISMYENDATLFERSAHGV